MLALLASVLLASASASLRSGAGAAPACGVPPGAPTTDPVAALYGTEYPWASASVNWTCIFDLTAFGSNADEAFEKAIAAASAQKGGAVVYVPKGTYKITKNVELASNVVIRGPSVTGAARNDRSPGDLKPEATVECAQLSHNGFFSIDPQLTNVGIVNLELSGCGVMMWPGLKTTGSTSWPSVLKSYWFESTDVTGMGANKTVLGNVIHDVSFGNPNPETPIKGMTWPWSFSIGIAVYTDANALVANNLLSEGTLKLKTSPTFKAKNGSDVTIHNIDYPVDNRYGIDVNQIILGGVAGKATGGAFGCPKGFGNITPKCFPYQFRTGITIRDNYVFQNGRVGVSFSGGEPRSTSSRGTGPQITSNMVQVKAGTTCWSVDGERLAGGADTNENRGYNTQGYGYNISYNQGEINRQKVSDTPYMTVDGEGILQQGSNGCSAFRNVYSHNDLSGGESGYISTYTLPQNEDLTFLSNKVNSDQHIGVLISEGGKVSGSQCDGKNSPKATLIDGKSTKPLC